MDSHPNAVRPVFLVAFFAAIGLFMTACGGGSLTDDTTGGSLRASAVPSPMPTAKPTPRYRPADANGRARNVPHPFKPALSSENSKEGAESFIRYWFWLSNYGYETGDMSEWVALSSGKCAFCHALERGVEANYRDGGWLAGGGVSLPIVRVTYKQGKAKQQIIAHVVQEATHYYRADKSIAHSPTPENSSTVGIYVSYPKGAWNVVDMGLLR